MQDLWVCLSQLFANVNTGIKIVNRKSSVTAYVRWHVLLFSAKRENDLQLDMKFIQLEFLGRSISFSSLKKRGRLSMTNIASYSNLSDKIFLLDPPIPWILFSMLFSIARIFLCRRMAAYYAVKSSNDRRAKKEAFDKIFARFDHNHNGGFSGLWLSSF